MQRDRSSSVTNNAESLDAVIQSSHRVQAMPPVRRALLAREALFAGAGKEMVFGPREARLRRILAWTGRAGLVMASFRLLIARIQTGRRISARSANVPEVVFIGIDALREKKLREHVTAEAGVAPVFVDQRSPEGFAPLPAPHGWRVLRNWRRVISLALSILSSPDTELSPIDLLSTLAMRCHELAYLLALFEELHIRRPDARLIFSTSDLPAHAACIAGFAAEYHQHGLLSRSLVFPTFSEMVALTDPEARYVAARVPGLRLKVEVPLSKQAVSRSVLALVGDYRDNDPEPVASLVDLALSKGFEVVVRPHPRGKDRPWQDIDDRERVRFELEGGFDEFLARWRPAFLATWYSTTLVDGLLAGALPITFSSGQSPLVLPLGEVAVAFPQNRELVEECMTDPVERARLHTKFMEVLKP
jgi:hypothetical protein